MRGCRGCPFNYGEETTELAYNCGCLPSIYEIVKETDKIGKLWACHEDSTRVCTGHIDFLVEQRGLLAKERIHWDVEKN